MLPPGEVPRGLRQMSVTLLGESNVRPALLELLKTLLKQEPNEMREALGSHVVSHFIRPRRDDGMASSQADNISEPTYICFSCA